jgi:CheY-like chemotaxis protein
MPHHGLTVTLGEAANSRRARMSDPHVEPIRRHVDAVIFEDCSLILKLYLKELRKVRGLEIKNSDTIESVEQAMAVFGKAHPDLVITDLQLTSGHLEGYEILRRVKERSPLTYVILTTSNYSSAGNDDFSRECRSKGFDAVFPKLDIIAPGEPMIPHIDALKAFLEEFTLVVH